MRKQFFTILLLAMSVSLFSQDNEQFLHDFELKLGGEYRYFFEEGQFEGQVRNFPSISITPKYSLEWNKGYEQLNFTGFFRLDRDSNRTHWDIRELYYTKAKGNWELNVGLKKIFWGVTESNHLVDIVNQTDQVETFDGEQKLGQGMVQFSLITDRIGTFDFIYLPHHRKRVFPGQKGRLRFANIIDGDAIDFENDNGQWYPGLALRWSHYFGIVDLGISQYFGNGREPLFLFQEDGPPAIFYPEIYQSGIDIQLTHNAFLWKLESIYRYAVDQEFWAITGGLEYTFSNIDGNGLDIGLLSEYTYDSRNELALTGLQNDLFVGSRIAFNGINDGSILIGTIVDLEHGSNIISLETSRRFGELITVEMEARIFNSIDPSEIILSNFGNDSFMRLSISTYLF